jgi:hypothetical protein
MDAFANITLQSQPLVDLYRTKGWTFHSYIRPVGQTDTVETWVVFQSPRNTMKAFLLDGFDEDTLLRTEREEYVRFTYGASLDTQWGQIRANILHQLTIAQSTVDAGKRGAAIPSEITLKELTLHLSHCTKALDNRPKST